ncbi:MAG TPA: hypothetical protein VES67_14185 [Vicinamibacterales bacterium]|nr:hypothetical protein [Vicinamibacterales bacterium]
MLGAIAAIAYARLDLTLSHYDARAHLVVARRVIDSLTPGWRQLGALWLPFPHLLNLLPVQLDWAYRSGATGVAISVLSLAGGLGALARCLHRHDAAFWTAVVAPLGILANPNVLYLQSTPMTEPLLIGIALLALDAVDQWIETGDRRTRTRAGWWLAALVLVRYEGWLIAAGLVAMALVIVGRRQFRSVVAVAAYPAIAVIAFLCLSRASTGAWFVASGFFVPENPAADQPLVALDQIVTGLTDLAGRAVPIAGAAGGVICLVLLARRRPAALPLALILPAVLPLSAFTAGHPYRIRYIVPLVAASWALAGIAISRVPRRWQMIGVITVAAVALIETPPFGSGIPMVMEAQREVPHQRAREMVTRYLSAEHDGTPILASMGSLGHYMQETSKIGLSLRQFLHEGNGDLWMGALERPRSHVKWILIEELAEGGDVLAARAKNDPAFLDGFVRVAEGGGVALYRRVK